MQADVGGGLGPVVWTYRSSSYMISFQLSVGLSQPIDWALILGKNILFPHSIAILTVQYHSLQPLSMGRAKCKM